MPFEYRMKSSSMRGLRAGYDGRPATLALRPFGSDTLAVVAYNLARDERLAEASLPSLAIVAVGLLPVALLARTVARDSA